MSKRKQRYFLRLYEPVHDQFRRFCQARAYYDMPCEDLINETLLVAYKRLGTLRNETAFLSFLISISKHILSNSKKKIKTKTVSNEYLLTQYPNAHNNIEQQSEIAILYKALAQLPEIQREAIVLFEITGFSIKEIASIQKSGESAIKQRLARGRKALAQIIKSDLSYKNPKV